MTLCVDSDDLLRFWCLFRYRWFLRRGCRLIHFPFAQINKIWKTCTCMTWTPGDAVQEDPWFTKLSENNKPGNRKLCINYLLCLFCKKKKTVFNALLLFSLQESDRKGVDGEGALKYFVLDASASAGKPAWQRESWMNPPKVWNNLVARRQEAMF